MHFIRAVHPCLQLDPLDDIAAVVRSNSEAILDDPAELLDLNAVPYLASQLAHDQDCHVLLGDRIRDLDMFSSVPAGMREIVEYRVL